MYVCMYICVYVCMYVCLYFFNVYFLVCLFIFSCFMSFLSMRTFKSSSTHSSYDHVKLNFSVQPDETLTTRREMSNTYWSPETHQFQNKQKFRHDFRRTDSILIDQTGRFVEMTSSDLWA
jgi:hypothetical protein